MVKIENWGNYLKKTYEEPRMEKRKEILKQYKNVDSLMEQFKKGELKPEGLSDALGQVTLGMADEHASAQIYSYDNLLKTISMVDSEKEIDRITEEALFDIAVERNPMKRAYLLGILCHNSSLGKAKKKSEEVNQRIESGESSDSDEMAGTPNL